MRPSFLICALGSFVAAALLSSPAAGQRTTRVSVDSFGVEGNLTSGDSGISISADGRHVAFASSAANLVPGDTNGVDDVFVHDRLTGKTIRVSVNSAGAEGNLLSGLSRMSADGRFVTFASNSTNLVVGDTNGFMDIFVHDCLTGQTSRVSLDSAGTQANKTSHSPFLSADGRYTAFSSYASNLVSGDTNGLMDVFIHDRNTGLTSRVSVDSAGVQGNGYSHMPAVSADGRFISFFSAASNLVINDTNNTFDIFVHDRQTSQTERISVSSTGVEGNGYSTYISAISGDGRYVAFESWTTNLVPGDTNNYSDVLVHDRQTRQTSRISVSSAGRQGWGNSNTPSFSSDGRFVAFYSHARNLVAGDTNATADCFVHDQTSGRTIRATVDSSGIQSSNGGWYPFISGDGRHVTFVSRATDLVTGDTNACLDVFVHDLGNPNPALIKFGDCPGAITLTITNASPLGKVAIACGVAGTFVKATPPCAGLHLRVSPPALTTVVSADGAGTAVLNFNVPAGACGRSVQAVDATTCTATNVVVL